MKGRCAVFSSLFFLLSRSDFPASPRYELRQKAEREEGKAPRRATRARRRVTVPPKRGGGGGGGESPWQARKKKKVSRGGNAVLPLTWRRGASGPTRCPPHPLSRGNTSAPGATEHVVFTGCRRRVCYVLWFPVRTHGTLLPCMSRGEKKQNVRTPAASRV